MDDILRNKCKYLKAFKGISYKRMAEALDIKQDSFYSWLKGYYDFSIERSMRLQSFIDNIKEV